MASQLHWAQPRWPLSYVGLFAYDIGLFLYDVGLFSFDIGLFLYDIGLLLYVTIETQMICYVATRNVTF